MEVLTPAGPLQLRWEDDDILLAGPAEIVAAGEFYCEMHKFKEDGLNYAEQLREKIKNHQARVGVVGLGYVGLPLAVEFADAGFHVTGIDIDANKVAALNRGESYIQDIPTATLKPLVEVGQAPAPPPISPPSRSSTPSTSASPRRCAKPKTRT